MSDETRPTKSTAFDDTSVTISTMSDDTYVISAFMQDETSDIVSAMFDDTDRTVSIISEYVSFNDCTISVETLDTHENASCSRFPILWQ